MTLYKVIETIKMLSLKHPNINSAYEGSIYEIMNANFQQKYASVVLTQQSHTQDNTYDHYNFNLFYVDRLVDDMESNRVQIQSVGKSILSNIIKAFCDEFDAECENITFNTFTERFADECAGVYCTITIDMLKDIYCTEKYWDGNWSAPVISIKNQNKKVEFTKNGNYTIEFDENRYTGLGEVEVVVNVPDVNGSYDEGYAEGYEGGYEVGYKDGYVEGDMEGYTEGYAYGYVEGNDKGIEEQKAKLESITITSNGTYSKEDGYNNVEVNVTPKVNLSETGIKLGHSSFSEVPEWMDFDNITDMSYMFYNCTKLTTIPLIDTSNVTTMGLMFYYCTSLTTIPQLDTSNVNNMDSMFYYCNKLTTIPSLDTSKVTTMRYMFYYCTSLTTIPQLDTSKVTTMERMFIDCRNLISIPQLDSSNVTNMHYIFSGCSKLTSVPPLNASKVTSISYPFGVNTISTLTDFGGFTNLKTSITSGGLMYLPNLTYQSCINVLNGLYDFVANNQTPTSSQGKLKVHANFLSLVGDEISIGTNKGWTITA